MYRNFLFLAAARGHNWRDMRKSLTNRDSINIPVEVGPIGDAILREMADNFWTYYTALCRAHLFGKDPNTVPVPELPSAVISKSRTWAIWDYASHEHRTVDGPEKTLDAPRYRVGYKGWTLVPNGVTVAVRVNGKKARVSAVFCPDLLKLPGPADMNLRLPDDYVARKIADIDESADLVLQHNGKCWMASFKTKWANARQKESQE